MKSHERAIQLGAEGKIREAKAVLDRAIASGDGDAACILAHWRMEGSLIRRDIREARALFAQAFRLGCKAAEDPLMALLASGAGGAPRDWQGALAMLDSQAHDREWAHRQRELIRLMAIDPDGTPCEAPTPAFLSQYPLIVHFPAFLTPLECDALIALARPKLLPSHVVHPQTGMLVRDKIRTSSAAAFTLVEENPLLHAINRRVAAASRSTWEQGEPTQILSYRPGEEYKLHSDALNTDNQRIMTFLAYLSDDFDGGETYFPHKDLRLRFPRGDAICFSNVSADMRPMRSAIHAGLAVRRGQKLVLSKWIRARPLDLAGPAGKPF